MAAAAAVAIVIAAALLAPYIYTEYEFDLHGEIACATYAR